MNPPSADAAMDMPKLYMIPGTATDRRMYAPQLERYPDLIIPEWLPPLNRREPLAEYARRWSASIDTAQPFWLGGVSLGGMIAQEMAQIVKPRGVILISTCCASEALPLVWRLSGKLVRWSPDWAVKIMLKCLGVVAGHLDAKRFPHRGLYAQMLKGLPPGLVRWQSGAATEWKGIARQLSMPVCQAHGANDVVIPLKRVHPRMVIQHGGHLINVTHAQEVNDFIGRCLSESVG